MKILDNIFVNISNIYLFSKLENLGLPKDALDY